MRLITDKRTCTRKPKPLARSFDPDSEYTQILTEVTTRQEALLKSLCPEQKELYDMINESTIDLSSVNDQDVFVKGFVLGAQLMMEIWQSRFSGSIYGPEKGQKSGLKTSETASLLGFRVCLYYTIRTYIL